MKKREENNPNLNPVSKSQRWHAYYTLDIYNISLIKIPSPQSLLKLVSQQPQNTYQLAHTHAFLDNVLQYIFD